MWRIKLFGDGCGGEHKDRVEGDREQRDFANGGGGGEGLLGGKFGYQKWAHLDFVVEGGRPESLGLGRSGSIEPLLRLYR